MVTGFAQVLSAQEWQTRKAAYRARLAPWVDDRNTRSSRGQSHPIRDFLFEYYFFRPGQLMRWSPGYEVLLAHAKPEDISWPQFQTLPEGLVLPAQAFPAHRRESLQWAITFLETTLNREPFYGCFGMHEWAMVYNDGEIRHRRVPLRLTMEETNTVVNTGPVRCTHYDAFRFFAPAARPLNRTQLTKTETTDHDQPGCVHANMDLYKFAFVVSPFIPGEYVAEAFELAMTARELDMRASPYDFESFGLKAIPIETKRGREEYIEGQQELYERAQPLRARLLAWYQAFYQSLVLNT